MARKIKVFLSGVVNSTNAQNLNCRALMKYLDPAKLEVRALAVYSSPTPSTRLPRPSIPSATLRRSGMRFSLSAASCGRMSPTSASLSIGSCSVLSVGFSGKNHLARLKVSIPGLPMSEPLPRLAASKAFASIMV